MSNNVSNILTVPIHLDALYIPERKELSVIEPMADFTRLPYFDGDRDVNPNVANISEEIVSEPFQDRGFQLKPGVHLHWALPDALTRGVHPQSDPEGKITFPIVPDRWLVIRVNKNGNVEKQWVVESDYLYEPGASELPNAIVYPYKDSSRPQPFRYMGRAYELVGASITLDEWLQFVDNDSNELKYLNKLYLNKLTKDGLTAVGYGEPCFAAFYPNCHSVFGFYDDRPPQDLNGVQYYVIGKYSDIRLDCLRSFIINSKGLQTFQTLQEVLQDEYKWLMDTKESGDKSTEEFPQRTIFYARLTFNTSSNSQPNDPLDEEKEVDIAVGNTSTEALSAYLAYISNLPSSDPRAFKEARSQLEDQLEALHLADALQGRKLDIGFKFKEARHEKGFTAVSGGNIWTIRPESKNSDGAIAPDEAETEVTLPEKLADALNDLNKLQQKCDRDDDEIESLRKELFADWYKYMLCAYPPEGSRDDYPDMDEVKYFIDKYDLQPLKARIERNESLKSECQNAIENLKAEIALLRPLRDENTQKNTVYTLKQIPAPRHWLPNEPAVIIADSTVKPTRRYGRDGRLRKDGLLECRVFQLKSSPDTTLIETINALEQDPDNSIGFSIWREQPWQPFLLEWEVEVSSIEGKYENIDAGYPLTRNYDPGTITENYELAEDGVELKLKPGHNYVKEANVYVGRSILTPHAQIKLKQQIDTFLEKELLSDYFKQKEIPINDRTNNYFAENRDAIIGWYENENEDKNEITDRILEIDRKVGENFYVLAQSLGGFNEALLMHKQTLQLPIDDPLGFEDYQSFTDDVRKAINRSNRVAPQPHNDFNPLRTGILQILQLRLVDNFGRVQTLIPKNVITTEALTTPEDSNDITLPPRLVQPARINFRWLSAEVGFIPESKRFQVKGNSSSSNGKNVDPTIDEPEMNSHPATTVICGWVLPNNLDSSLMVYDAKGLALGSINQYCQWMSAPGRFPVSVWQISNPHLRKLIDYIIKQGEGFLGDFLTVVDNALDNIDPENAAQHQAIALLMGRPIAVVRAALDLELQGLPALDQGWNIFRQAVEAETQKDDDNSPADIERDTQNFTQVKFPIRIGEYRQLNDSLVGYFIEEGTGYKDDTFYALQGKIKPDAGKAVIVTEGEDINILQSIADPAQTLTMLVDPRGSVHATSGILPTKSIHIPSEQFVDALRNIEITFLTAPILSDGSSINLPLPQESGYSWSWLAKENGIWDRVTAIGSVSDQATFTTQQQIHEGWLKLTQDSQQ
jgi:hypothetical protein